jgi:hypothetical protein
MTKARSAAAMTFWSCILHDVFKIQQKHFDMGLTLILHFFLCGCNGSCGNVAIFFPARRFQNTTIKGKKE